MTQPHAKSFFSDAQTDKRPWRPLETIAICGLNVFVFGALMGQGHFDYVMTMMIPSIVLCSLVLAFHMLVRTPSPAE